MAAYGYFTLFLCFTSNVWAQRTPTITHITQMQIRDIGSPVALDCTVHYAQDYPVLWVKYDRQNATEVIPLSTNSVLFLRDSRFSLRFDEDAETYTLAIRELQETDSGWYQCQVITSVSNKVTAEVELQVRRPQVASEGETTSSANFELIGPPGLILDDNTIPYNRYYSYKFEKPLEIGLVCRLSGVIGHYELVLEDDRGIGKREIFIYSGAYPLQHEHVDQLFWLTPQSRTIGCTARDLNSNTTRFMSTIALKYKHAHASTTAPSISTSTLSSHPQNQSDDERNPLDDDISHPQNQSDYDMCSEASAGQLPGEGSRLCTEKLLVKAVMRSARAAEKQAEAEMRSALAAEKQAEAEMRSALAAEKQAEAEMRSALAAEKQAEAEMRTALAAEKQAEAVQQRSAQGVGLLRDLVAILGGAPPALTIDRGNQV